MDLTAILTVCITALASYMSYRLGKQQLTQSAKSTDQVDKTTGETEFRKSLLDLIDSQEDKLTRQDAKIEKLDVQVDQSKNLTDELKRANFNLTLENQRLTRIMGDLEADVRRLRDEVALLKQKQGEQHNDK
jgi:hypothetical protein